ncbi:hypothetical protein HT594_00051 [Phenacoccus solenopsis nudivirus]|nr:hypothetical protein HT594_00051 [Phenacoccus solenopsis nudivirus]
MNLLLSEIQGTTQCTTTKQNVDDVEYVSFTKVEPEQLVNYDIAENEKKDKDDVDDVSDTEMKADHEDDGVVNDDDDDMDNSDIFSTTN